MPSIEEIVQFRESNRARWLEWILWAPTLMGLLYLTGMTIWLAWNGLRFPYQLDYGEGLLLHFVNEWAHGRPIYGAIGQYPFVTSNYPPLTILLALTLAPLFGISYLAGRVWTLLAVAVIAAIIAVWVRRDTGRWLPAATAALAFVGSPYIFHWAPLFRVDLVGLAFTLSGLLVITFAFPFAAESPRRQTHPGMLWIAAILFVAGLYAKQSFLFAPAAATLYLLVLVDWRQAAKLVLRVLALGGGLFLAINILTGGGFWQGLVVSNVNAFLWPEFWQQQADFFGTFAILGLLALWYAVDKFLLDRAIPWREKTTPLDLYLPSSMASLLLAGKAGAWENYFFEALAALCLCGGMGVSRLARHRKQSYRWLAPVLVLVQIALMWHTPSAAHRYLQLTARSNEALEPVLAPLPDPVISEDMGLLITNGKVMDYCSFQYSQLARVGRWDQSWELGQLRDRRLSAVILEEGTRTDVDRYQRFTREFLSELDRNYGLALALGKYELYEPAPLQHEKTFDFGDQLSLLGWSLHAGDELKPGDKVELTVVWQAQRALDDDFTAFAHMVDESGTGWAGDDHPPFGGLYPTSAWGPEEMVRDTFSLAIPLGTKPGLYDVRVGWYHPNTLERLPVGQDDSVRIAVIPVDWSEATLPSPTVLAASFGDQITLEGYSWQPYSDQLQITLRWSAAGYVGTDYTVFVHLAGPTQADGVLAQGDAPPLRGRWPTSLWLPGVSLNDLHTIPLPTDLKPGTYRIYAGLYDPITGVRLSLPDGNDALLLTEIGLP